MASNDNSFHKNKFCTVYHYLIIDLFINDTKHGIGAFAVTAISVRDEREIPVSDEGSLLNKQL